MEIGSATDVLVISSATNSFLYTNSSTELTDPVATTSKIPQSSLDWTLSNSDATKSKCYLNNVEADLASPSLRQCYVTNSNACCNYMSDNEIKDQFE